MLCQFRVTMPFTTVFMIATAFRPSENNRDPSSKLLAVLRAGEPYKGVEVAATHAAPAAGFVTLQYVPLKGER